MDLLVRVIHPFIKVPVAPSLRVEVEEEDENNREINATRAVKRV